jgi:hypothetical protein
MGSKFNAGVAFKFTCTVEEPQVVYTYNPHKGVTGGTIRDPIVYTTARVNKYLEDGIWVVVGEKFDFPRAGIYAKVDTNVKAFVVGPSTQTGYWVVEVDGGSVFKVRVGQLKELQADDTKAFDIARDLNVSFNTAMQMVKKGYGKL